MIDLVKAQVDSNGGQALHGPSAAAQRNAWLLQLERAWLALNANHPHDMGAHDGAAPPSMTNERAVVMPEQAEDWPGERAASDVREQEAGAVVETSGIAQARGGSPALIDDGMPGTDDMANEAAVIAEWPTDDRAVASPARATPDMTVAGMTLQAGLNGPGRSDVMGSTQGGLHTTERPDAVDAGCWQGIGTPSVAIDGMFGRMPALFMGNEYGNVAGVMPDLSRPMTTAALRSTGGVLPSIPRDMAMAVSVSAAVIPSFSVVLSRAELSNHAVGRALPTLAPADEANVDEAADVHHAPHEEQSDVSFSRRHLHVYRDDEGIRAWIRDTSLSSSDVHAVARDLRHELGESSLALTALTINGKPVDVKPDRLRDAPFLEFMPEVGEENEGGTGADSGKAIMSKKGGEQHGN